MSFPRRLPRASVRMLFAFAMCSVALSVALGATEGELLFQDDYSTLDASLGPESAELSVSNNILRYTLESGYMWRSFYEALLFDDVDVTIQVRLPDFTAESNGVIGLMFWGASFEEYHLLEISDAGTFAVHRRAGGRWFTPVGWRDSDAIKKELGAWNELRVVTSGNVATLHINGKQVARIQGRPPVGGSLIGPYLEAGTVSVVGEYSALKVLQGPAPNSTATPTDSNLLFSDDFAVLDAVWGSERGWFGVKDGHLFMDFEPHQTYKTMYQADVFHEIELTAKLRVQGAAGDNESASGVIFWSDGADNDYVFTLFSDGVINVARNVNKRRLFPIKDRPLPAESNFDPQGWTEVRIRLQDRKLTIAVNGIEIASAAGQPPEGGSFIGLYGRSGNSPSTSQFTELVVRNP